jgi:diadenosine tetraphosphate (Ap4A) HIT family hydrolase
MSEAAPLHLKSCGFCRILAGKAEGSFVFRDERVAAFMDITPVTPGHLLVIPIRHAVYLSDLDPADGARMFEVAQSLTAAMRRQNGDSPWESHRALRSDSPHFGSTRRGTVPVLKCEAVNLLLADGEQAGQDVPHVHLHVIPRFHGDGFSLKLPPGYGQHPERSELDRIALAIKAGLKPE